MLQDLLELVAGVVRFGNEGILGHLHTQDVGHHVGSQPAHKWGTAGGVMCLPVVEQKPIHLQRAAWGRN